jgi:hypothetical protein
MMLVRYKLAQSFVFCTVTLGAQISYSDVEFYKKEFESDALRVNNLFRDAQKLGVTVLKTSVPCNALKALLLTSRIILVVLVDHSKLRVHTTKKQTSNGAVRPIGGVGGNDSVNRDENDGSNSDSSSEIGSPSPTKESQYLGHYIVVCGYCASSDTFVYMDPAIDSPSSCTVPSDLLEAARMRYAIRCISRCLN